MSEHAPWPTSSASIGSAAAGAIGARLDGDVSNGDISQIASMMDAQGSAGDTKLNTKIPDEHAHLAPKSADINYPRGVRAAQAIDPASMSADAELSKLLANGHEVIGLDHYTPAPSTKPDQGKKQGDQVIRG